MKFDEELVAKAEAILDRTLAYQAAQAVHELKATLGIDIHQINLAVSAMPDSPGSYRVVCTVQSVEATQPVEILLTRYVANGSAGSNGG
jgi:hypothetical protein